MQGHLLHDAVGATLSGEDMLLGRGLLGLMPELHVNPYAVGRQHPCLAQVRLELQGICIQAELAPVGELRSTQYKQANWLVVHARGAFRPVLMAR